MGFEEIFEIIFSKWFCFGLLGLLILSVYYGSFSKKPINMNDNKTLQFILPLWILTIITIGYLLHTATYSNLEYSYWLTGLSSVATLALSAWAMFSI